MKMPFVIFTFLLLGAGVSYGLTLNKIEGPAGSEEFGRSVLVLGNGNVVVADPWFDRSCSVADSGAVYVFRPDGTLINRIQGSTTGDRVGSGRLTLLNSGNFVVHSPNWDNGATVDAGAVTFGNAETGFDVGVLGNLTSSNSLVGGNTDDLVGNYNVTALRNGHYLVKAPSWNGTRGAITWGNGFYGTSGVVNATNSVVGSTVGDQLLNVSIRDDGSYIITAPDWNNGGVVDAGAVRLCRGDRQMVLSALPMRGWAVRQVTKSAPKA